MSDGYLSKDRNRICKLQRARRARLVRIDYMPSGEALEAIAAKRAERRPGSVEATNSAILDSIVAEWARLTGINNQELEVPISGGTCELSAHLSPYVSMI